MRPATWQNFLFAIKIRLTYIITVIYTIFKGRYGAIMVAVLTEKSKNNYKNNSPNHTKSQRYDNNDLYQQKTITDNGSSLYKTDDGVYQRNYRWNERNLLRESSDSVYTVQYRYGSDGQRAIKYVMNNQSTTLYYNNMWQESNSTKDWMVSKHVYVGEDRIATKNNYKINDNTMAEERRTYYYHSDHLGSAQTVTNHDGLIHERLEYTPYGELWIDWKNPNLPGDNTPFRFTGKEMDQETGLYYYGARYLDPKTSRWLSGDPAMGEYIPSAPVNEEAKKRNGNLPGMGGVYNTVNLHVYHYAANNPVKYVDPTGRTSKNHRIGSGDDLKFDRFGLKILFHYLFGGGKDLNISNKNWSNYMRKNELLSSQINNALMDIVYSQDSGTNNIDFSIQIHVEIENGESIIGYQYLHGSNPDMGDVKITGTMIQNVDGTITASYSAQWNDIMDPNPDYPTDIKKAKFAKVMSFGASRDYIMRIRWENTVVLIHPDQFME